MMPPPPTEFFLLTDCRSPQHGRHGRLRPPLPVNPPPKPSMISLSIIAIGSADTSIHAYHGDAFREVGSAYLLSGGSEGIVASRSATPLAGNAIRNGRSYIRFENITFWRSKEAADQRSKMEHGTGLIQVINLRPLIEIILVEQLMVGRGLSAEPLILLSWEVVSKVKSLTSNKWPIILNVQFKRNYLSTHMDNKVVYIKKTGMYNLFFVIQNSRD